MARRPNIPPRSLTSFLSTLASILPPTKLSTPSVILSNNHPTISRNEAYALISAFILFRTFSIVGLYLISGGKELASDVVFHELIIQDPLGILKGTAINIASYPPFQWLIEWPLFSLFTLYFGEMISYRLMMVTVELATFLVAIAVFRMFVHGKTVALSILVFFIISPHQYFASVFFIQEDVIAQLFMLLALLFLLYEKNGLCITTLVLGVLIAKLFFVVPLFYVVLFHGQRPFLRRVVYGALALIPLVVVYIFIITQALTNGGEVPIRDFTPDAKYAANFWVLLINSDAELLVYYKNFSLVLTTIVQFMIIVAFLYIHTKKGWLWHPAILLVVPLAFFFGTFYQHMPEYLLMLWPVAALVCTAVWHQLLLVCALTFAWAPRISHGLTRTIEGFGTSAEARTEIVGPLIDLFNIDYTLLNKAALVMQSVIYPLLVLWLCLLCRKLQQRYANPEKA